MADERVFEGLLVRIAGAEYVVAGPGGDVPCVLRGKLRIAGTPGEVLPVVGDTVRARRDDGSDTRGARGVVLDLLPRRAVLARVDPSQRAGYRVMGANMDRAVLVFAVREPAFNGRLLDRMIVAAEHGGVEPVVCLNKIDLADERPALERALAAYEAMGYRIVRTSAKTGEGTPALGALLGGARSILAGPSGSGKSSLLARVQPGLEIVTGPVSGKTGKGKHTTTRFELHRLDGGGYVGDTPGVREFGIWGVGRADLASYFRDFAPYRSSCRFASCTHSHEPDCAVKEAVAVGAVSAERYESYLRMLETLAAPDFPARKRAGGRGKK